MFIMAAFYLSTFYEKYVSDSSDGDLSREDKTERGTESSRNESSENDRDSFVNEGDQESLTDITISQSWKRVQTKTLKLLVVQSKSPHFHCLFFHRHFDRELDLATLSDCIVCSVK